VAPGELDAPRTGVTRFHVYLVRFQLLNDADLSLDLAPRLEVGLGATPSSYAPVPAVDPADGNAFYAASDEGPGYRVRTLDIATSGLRLTTIPDLLATPVAGSSYHGLNPGGAVRLPGHSFTEVEFAVRATVDAAWSTTYAFRLVGGGASLGSPSGILKMGARPAVPLNPGQHDGIDVDPVAQYPLAYTAFATATTAILASYALLGPTAGFVSPHANYTLTTDACAACHSSHTAQGPLLLRDPAPQATLCFGCHDGAGAAANTKEEYTDLTVPANVSSTSSWYSHPATAVSASTHTTDRQDEFGDQLNRHATCADCHQPHSADGTLAAETTTGEGWTASGALKGASGVSVVNGAAGIAPTYVFNQTSTLEYQLCFKCHSGFTLLPAQDPAHPSRWALDKAVELNPANLSFHPIEGPGKNQTAAMAASLAGPSTYKLWDFQATSTVRCVNCHGDSRKATPSTPPDPSARLAPHAVKNQGVLMANYRNGDLVASIAGSGLTTSLQAYRVADFALCYQCHADAPFGDTSGTPASETNFSLHGKHTAGINKDGPNGDLDIDVSEAGRGNALCAECHFRTHGTTYAVNGQAATPRLVNFSPNVGPSPTLGKLEFNAATRTCTLTCHGKDHSGYSY